MSIPDVVELTRQLVRIESTTYREGPVAEWLADRWRAAGWHVIVQPMPGGDPAVSGQRANVLALSDPDVPPEVVFTTHIDTVPPYVPLREDDTHLFGRGTCDAKGVLAAEWVAAERLRAGGARRLALLAVVGEETDSDGARAVPAILPRARFVVDGEPTRLTFASAAKGVLGLEVRAQGVAAHSAYPERGHSALHDLIPALARVLGLALPSDPRFGPTTVNVGRIDGGVAPNVLAPAASAELLVRLGAPAAEVKATLAAALAGLELRVTTENEPRAIYVPDGLVGAPVSFGSDVPYLAKLGTPLLLGPGDIHDAHTAGEKIGKAELAAAVLAYESLGQRLLREAKVVT